ncbi:MAG: FecR domain-containing protein [Pseudomonadota bacterium]
MPDLTPADKAALRTEALDWLRRLHSGEATPADAEALERWRARSPAHARAFADAALFWGVLGEAAGKAERDRAIAMPALRPDRHPTRRGFVVGGAALAASAAGVLAVRPPLALWPSVAELAADYRTGTGERRQLEIGDVAAVELNTRTSLDLRPPADGDARIELITGEAAVSTRGATDRELVVIAGNGRVASHAASFNIRKDGAAVSVSCITGAVAVTCRDRTVAVGVGQQLAYDGQGIGEVTAIDPETITAWKRGLLMFRREPLSRVIDEVNRYRSGRVILVDAALGQRQIVANFRLDRIDDVVDFMAKAMGIRVRSLPGGVVLVG